MGGYLLRLLLVGGFILGFMGINRGQVKEVQFKGLKQYMQKSNDTLYVINFWATWCKPCVAELPDFEKINKKFRNEPVQVILVSLDFSKNLESDVIPFVKKRNLSSRVLFLHQPRGDDWMNAISPNWSGAIPATLFIKNAGEQKAFYEEKLGYQKIYKTVQRLK